MEESLHCLRRNTHLIGRYIIQKVLGQGGFGITYLGIDELNEKKVAIKEFFPQGIVTRNIEYGDDVTVTVFGERDNYDKGKERFLKEARNMEKFRKNEGVVEALDFFEVNNTAYIVMEYLEGITLKQYLKENGTIEPEKLLELCVPLMESLDELHSQGVIHRDISPDNIMVLYDGRIKLMDFGAARDYTEFGEKSLSIVLKPGYAPPEQYQTHGIQGPWTDIYALCATMYKCLTGENPPDAIERVMDDRLKKISEFGIDISSQIEFAIIKGMNVSAKERYQNIKRFCEDLYKEYEVRHVSEKEESEIKSILIKENIHIVPQKEASNIIEESIKKDVKIDVGIDIKTPGDRAIEEKSLIQSKIIKEKTVSEKITSVVKNYSKTVAVILVCILLIGIGGKYYFYKKSQYTLHNPKVEKDSSTKLGEKVTWDCLWFGSYPQSEITEKNEKIYTALKKTNNWNENGDIIIENSKYHKTEDGYFKYEPIKWRVLQCESEEVFLVSDIVLDYQPYHEQYNTKVDWNTCSLREWLNDEFINNAFSVKEKKAINGLDKIFILSSLEINEKEEGSKYGFLNDETRICYKSDFSRSGATYLLSSWVNARYPSRVDGDGYVYEVEHYISDEDNAGGVRPALYLKFSESNLFSYAGTVSSNGKIEKVARNSKNRFIPK